MSTLDLYVVVIVHLGSIPAVAYPILYGRWADWRSSRVGRALMWKAVSLAALFVVSVANFWLPAWGPFLLYPYALVVTAVTVALTRQVIVLIAVFREARK